MGTRANAARDKRQRGRHAPHDRRAGEGRAGAVGGGTQVTLLPLKPNDITADNGPAIREYALAGLPLPSGLYYVRTTIELPLASRGNVGARLAGAGTSDQARADATWCAGLVTAIVWSGDTGGTLFRIKRSGTVFQDVMLVGAPIPKWP